MDPFTRNDLRALMSARHKSCASIYTPTHRTGREIREDAVRLKNQINQAEERLVAAGLRSPEAREILEPARRLLADEMFMRDLRDGLAIFAAPGFFKYYRLPLRFEERVTANTRFQVGPLLPLLQADGRYYLLAVSQNHVRFFRGTHYTIAEMYPEKLPRSLQDALQIDEFKESLQRMTYTGVGVAGPVSARTAEAAVHGHGGSSMDVRKSDEIREFFVRLNDGLDEFFGEENAPLVFAGVEYLFPIFRHVCHYRRLVETPVTGNPDGLKVDELHEKAWRLVEPMFARSLSDALERYGTQVSHGLGSGDLREIIAAAHAGRIENLFVASGEEVWGHVDDKTGAASPGRNDEPNSEELLDHAAVQTLLHGGTVFAVDRDRMPGKGPIAASFRFRATQTGGEPGGNETAG
jgi:hypothetical protein